MTDTFQCNFPDWPPKRLVREAVVSWGLRHLGQDKIDAESSPWPLVRGTILSFLRHMQTDYDERLRVRAERDAQFRDALVAQVTDAAFKRYPWLRDDPRPFAEDSPIESVLPLDWLARDLSNLHSVRDHLVSAINDLKRQGNNKKQIVALEETLRKTREEIDLEYRFLSAPKTIKEVGKSRCFVQRHSADEIGKYHFYSNKKIIPNRIEYIGFRCPKCGTSVARWKQIVALGQGYRCVIFACHCITCAIHCPPQDQADLLR